MRFKNSLLVRPPGFEPGICGLGGRHPTRLDYGRSAMIKRNWCFKLFLRAPAGGKSTLSKTHFKTEDGRGLTHMSGVSGVERFLLAYIYYEYGGKLYFQAVGGEAAERFLAEFIAEDFVPRSNPNFSKVSEGFAGALRSLREKGLVVMRGFEVTLTEEGRRLASSVPREEYSEVKKKFRQTK